MYGQVARVLVFQPRGLGVNLTTADLSISAWRDDPQLWYHWKVPENHTPGWPKTCWGNWVDETVEMMSMVVLIQSQIWFTQNIVVLSKGSCYWSDSGRTERVHHYQWNNVQSDCSCRWLDPARQLPCRDAKAAVHQFGFPRIGSKHHQVQCICYPRQLRSGNFSFVNTCVSLTIDGTTLPVVNTESKSPCLRVQPDWKNTTQTLLCLPCPHTFRSLTGITQAQQKLIH